MQKQQRCKRQKDSQHNMEEAQHTAMDRPLWQKVKVHTLDIAPLRSESPSQKRSGMTCSQGISQFYLHTHTFIRNRNEPYLPLPSQPQLVLIYRPRRDGRLSRPWCEVAQARSTKTESLIHGNY